jgi:hypothetical protein
MSNHFSAKQRTRTNIVLIENQSFASGKWFSPAIDDAV